MAQAQPKFLSAKQILDLLATKHSKDVFVPECKDGPTQSVSNHLRMDAWVMNRSWAHPCYTAYEIKSYRGDFLQDRKWRGYLPYCNEFFFVAPKGLIKPDELPPEAGLLEVLGEKRLVRRKQAQWRDVEVPESLFRYVLMCRTLVARNEWSREQTKQERADEFRQMIADKVETRKLSYRVREAIREKVNHVEAENSRLKELMGQYDDVRRVLTRLDVDPDGYVSGWAIERAIEARQKLIPDGLRYNVESLKNSLERMLREIDRLNQSEEKAVAA